MEGAPKFESSDKKEKPENGGMSRRDFLKILGKTGVAIATMGSGALQMADISTYRTLEKWELEQSERDWEAWQEEMLKFMRNSISYLNNIDVHATATVKGKKQEYLYQGLEKEIDAWESIIQDSLKDLPKKQDKILGLVKDENVQNSKMYREYLKSFNDWLNIRKDETLDLWGKYEKARYSIDDIEQFLENIIYSKKTKDEYDVTVNGESTRFFLADVKSFYEALGAIPRFAIKKSGFKKLNLAEITPGAAAQMGGSEMSGQFKKWDANASNAYHELTHAFDGHIEKGSDNIGWANINRGAKPYLYSSGQEAIDADLKNPSAVNAGNVEGYASVYGWKGGIWEDKATVSAALFSEYSLRELINRAMKDPVLKRKVEFMVGYKLDNPYILKHSKDQTDKDVLERYEKEVKSTKKWVDAHIKDEDRKKSFLSMLENANPKMYNFGTALTEKDYQDAGFAGYSYWPIWSRDEMGKTWMDAKYFNAILEGKKVKFTEEKGQTFMEITPRNSNSTFQED